MVAEVMAMHKLSQRRACGLIGISRRAYQFKVRADRNLKLRQRLRELAEEKRRWGCPLLYQWLKREGFAVNHKRVERLYREEGLSLRRKRRRKNLSHVRVTLPPAERANQVWALDFVHDSLLSGRRFRALTIIDQWSRECPAIAVDTSLTGARVTRVLEQLKETRGLPGTLQSDNELSKKAMAGRRNTSAMARRASDWSYLCTTEKAMHRRGSLRVGARQGFARKARRLTPPLTGAATAAERVISGS